MRSLRLIEGPARGIIGTGALGGLWDLPTAPCGHSAERKLPRPLYHRPHLTAPVLPFPRLPVAGWDCLFGTQPSSVPEVASLPHCLFTTSGRAAIGLALEELGVGRGDRVLVPSYHCPTMVSPIAAFGAIPVFYPIDTQGLPIVAELERMELQSVKAMLAVHYFGIPRSLS